MEAGLALEVLAVLAGVLHEMLREGVYLGGKGLVLDLESGSMIWSESESVDFGVALGLVISTDCMIVDVEPVGSLLIYPNRCIVSFYLDLSSDFDSSPGALVRQCPFSCSSTSHKTLETSHSILRHL